MELSTPDTRLHQQRLAALELANQARLNSAYRRRELGKLEYRDGLLLAAEWVVHPPPELRATRLVLVLRAVRRVGKHRARRLLMRAALLEVAESPLRDLTLIARRRLAMVLREAAAEVRDA